MSDRRRQEIESKRAKLAELRKARAERQRIDAEKRIPDVRSMLDGNHIDIEVCLGTECIYFQERRCR